MESLACKRNKLIERKDTLLQNGKCINDLSEDQKVLLLHCYYWIDLIDQVNLMC